MQIPAVKSEKIAGVCITFSVAITPMKTGIASFYVKNGEQGEGRWEW